ncbi:hypothetical protein J2W32_004446 [Variovorax boronicumulans]|uniref:Uncharacterized protein n=1 Tax=Variovorax boronicumulans TaxID=436515 RepID=A0AAW8CVA0_9BURK|nr:hypothetical protein [Variovorax boronicumulans]MDP9895348.1 hypothetical protein [Variovorax boronicumulans]MDQ0055388.1 hypothetical protein [Variovorax boronicumulans]
MIAVDQQDSIDIYAASEGSIVIAQTSEGQSNLVAIRPQNINAVIRALRAAHRDALTRRQEKAE